MSQEEIVDNIILDFLEEKHPTSKSIILASKDKSKKRTAMLSVLDIKNQGIFDDYKKIVEAPNNSKCHEYIIEVTQLLREYIKVADTDIKNYGEVLTPTSLINNMLDFLPIEVWSDKDLKWLDPCNGVGMFPAVVVTRLMAGLKDVIPNDCERYEHIVNNMIYVCEIQAKNMFLYHCSFDRKDEHKLNTYFGSFLTNEFNEHMANVWGVEKFDIIVANPPYQSNNPGERKTHPLWHKFVENSISILSEGGYLNIIHPSGWRNIDGDFKNVQNLIKSKDVLCLEIHNEKDGLKTFGAETRYDFYCLRNTNTGNHNTTIKYQDGTIENVDIKNMEFIPNEKFNIFKNLIAKVGEDKVNILYSRSSYGTDKKNMANEKSNEFKYPCIYTIKKGDIPTFKYSNLNDKGHYGVPKLIWSNGRVSSVGSFIDMNGEYGLTQFSYGIIDEPKNLLNIKKAFDTKRFRDLMEACAMSDMSINRKVIATFRKDFWKEFI